ncbi:hypothetical protein EB118_14230 [bacterium]|nr:hypothetical protein [bacterium]
MKVLIINGPKEKCGIYQYSQSLYDALSSVKSKYQYEFFPTGSRDEAKNRIAAEDIHAVIYNHHPMALEWLDSGFTRPIKNDFGIKQIMITGHEHETRYIGVDQYVYTDPNHPTKDNVHSGMPPLLYYDDIQYTAPQSDVIKIGTSGIGNSTKNLHELVEKVNKDFANENVLLNVHITDGAYVDSTGKFSNMLGNICKEIAAENVEVNIVREFFTKRNLVQWLNINDINIYYHTVGPPLGVSSSIDRAIESKKPFGINESNFFKHVIRDYNNLNKTSIKEILAIGIDPYKEFYDAWNPVKLVELYEKIIGE